MFRLPADGNLKTRNTHLATACVMVGIPITTHRKIHEGTGEQQYTFTLADRSITQGANISTAEIIGLHTSGKLEEKDPTHPFLDALRGLTNRQGLVKWIFEGKTQALTLHPDTRCPRTLYAPGKPTAPPVIGAPEFVQTPHIAVAAALGVVGIPVIKIESGSGGLKIFTLPRYGFTMHATRQMDAKKLIEDFASGKLEKDTPTHPFLLAHDAVRMLAKIKEHMKREVPMIYFEDAKGSGRYALIRGDATSEAFDSSQKFFNRRL